MLNLSPATADIVLAAVAAEAVAREAAFHRADAARAELHERHGRARGARERALAGPLADATAAAQHAEREAHQARWALAEVRRAAGLDPDRDAAELAKGSSLFAAEQARAAAETRAATAEAKLAQVMGGRPRRVHDTPDGALVERAVARYGTKAAVAEVLEVDGALLSRPRLSEASREKLLALLGEQKGEA